VFPTSPYALEGRGLFEGRPPSPSDGVGSWVVLVALGEAGLVVMCARGEGVWLYESVNWAVVDAVVVTFSPPPPTHWRVGGCLRDAPPPPVMALVRLWCWLLWGRRGSAVMYGRGEGFWLYEPVNGVVVCAVVACSPPPPTHWRVGGCLRDAPASPSDGVGSWAVLVALGEAGVGGDVWPRRRFLVVRAGERCCRL